MSKTTENNKNKKGEKSEEREREEEEDTTIKGEVFTHTCYFNI
jgi:hypothetical protein